MTMRYTWALAGMFCLLTSVGAGATHAAPPTAPALTYRLERLPVAGADPPESLWVVQAPFGAAVRLDSEALPSLASPTLRGWIASFLHSGGAAFVYDPGTQPQAPASELTDFAVYCRSQGLTFVAPDR